MKYKILNIIILVGTVIFLLSYMFFVDGFENISTVFRSANLLWLAAGFGCMLLYWICETVIMRSAFECFPHKMSFKQAFKTCMIGQMFNCLTPSATGGQPMQVYYMARNGISAGYATSSLMVRFIVYQIGLALYCLGMLIFRYRSFASEISNFRFLVIFGFAVTALVAIILMIIGLNKEFGKKIMHGIVIFLTKIKIMKKPEKYLDIIDVEAERFNKGFKTISSHKGRLLYMAFVTILQLSVYFFVPVTIAYAFGVEPVKILTMMAASAFVLLASSFVPLPGAAGGAELSFFVIFGMFFSSGQLSSAVLLWRIFVFYLPIVAGYFFANGIFRKKAVSGGVNKK